MFQHTVERCPRCVEVVTALKGKKTWIIFLISVEMPGVYILLDSIMYVLIWLVLKCYQKYRIDHILVINKIKEERQK